MVPALVPVHVGVHHLAVDFLLIGVDLVDHLAPHIHVPLVAGEQQRIAEPGDAQPVGVAVGQSAGLRHHHGEAPPITPAVPLALGAADGAVQADLGRDDALVGQGALAPGVHVLQQPLPVLRLAGEQVRVEPQGGGHQILGVVSDNVGVVLKVGQHLLKVALAVPGREAALHLDGIAGPVQGGGVPQKRPAAAVEHAADDLALAVVVGGRGVVAQVEAGVPLDPPLKVAVARVGQALQVEDREALAVVHPVEGDRKLPVVHAVAGKGHVDSPGFGVLAQVPLPGLLVQVQDDIGRAQGVQDGPTREALDGVVRPVVAAPALDAAHVPALVKVVVEEFLARPGLGPEQLPLQQGPGRRGSGGVHSESRQILHDLPPWYKVIVRRDENRVCRSRRQVVSTFRSGRETIWSNRA